MWSLVLFFQFKQIIGLVSIATSLKVIVWVIPKMSCNPKPHGLSYFSTNAGMLTIFRDQKSYCWLYIPGYPTKNPLYKPSKFHLKSHESSNSHLKSNGNHQEVTLRLTRPPQPGGDLHGHIGCPKLPPHGSPHSPNSQPVRCRRLLGLFQISRAQGDLMVFLM